MKYGGKYLKKRVASVYFWTRKVENGQENGDRPLRNKLCTTMIFSYAHVILC